MNNYIKICILGVTPKHRNSAEVIADKWQSQLVRDGTGTTKDHVSMSYCDNRAIQHVQKFTVFFVLRQVTTDMRIPGGPKKRNSQYSRFSDLCSIQQLYFFTLLDRASFSHYNNTKIIKFGWESFILWVISYGLSFSGFARFPEFRGTMTN